MKKPIIILLSITLLAGFIACNDIINTDSNIQKDLIFKKLTAEDSLNFLVTQELNLGSLKVGSLGTGFPSVVNSSKDKTISIYKIEQKNQSGLFVISIKNGLPINLIPGGDIQFNERVKVKFIADAFTLGFYYDTLFLNGSKKVYIPIVAKIRY